MDNKTTKQPKRRSKVIHLWKKTEDEQLLEAVKKFGEKDWNSIKENVPTRTKKQCKERYFNHLCEKVVKTEWTKEEDNLILDKMNEFGHHWTLISGFIPNRAPNSIKNRFYTHLSKVLNQSPVDVNTSNSLVAESEVNVIQSAFLPALTDSYAILNVNSFYWFGHL